MVSAYKSVSAGDYSVKMRAAGSAASSQPVLTADVTVQGSKSYTATALSVNGQAQLKILNDELAAPTGKSWVRVIQVLQLPFHGECLTAASSVTARSAALGYGE
jgi:hypothetical protein